MSAKKPTKAIKKKFVRVAPYRLLMSFAFLSLVCITLLVLRIAFSDSLRYTFLFWNLLLAFAPALISWWLVNRVRKYGWLKWQQVALTLLWIVFLPNSFYIITDLIHLRANYEADLLFDITLITGFIMAGLSFGYASVYMIHSEMLKRIRELRVYEYLAVLFLVVSFAICLGRYLRWNTWDIVLRPAGLLFDVSDRLINPYTHLQTYETTMILFLILFGGYTVVYEAIRYLKAQK